MKNSIDDSFKNNELHKSNNLNINTLNNDFQEEDEEIEDQKRRNEELRDLLEVAFTDITNEISDDESDTQNSVEIVNVDIDNLCHDQQNSGAHSSSETVNYLFNRQELDDIYKKYQQNESTVPEDTSYSPALLNKSLFSCQSRRRPISSHRISQLSPLKEVDISYNVTNDTSSQCLEPSESSSNVVSEKVCSCEEVENSKVQKLRVLTERVHELQNELECIKDNHNKVVNLKNSELEQVNKELETTRKLLVETQIKLRESEDQTKTLKSQQEKTLKDKEILQCELQGTRTKLIDLENQITCLKQQLKTCTIDNTQKIEEIKVLESKVREQISTSKKTINEKNEIKCDLESRLCNLTFQYNKLLAERNDICSSFDETSAKLKNIKEETREIARQLDEKITENDNLKQMNEELTEKFSKLIPELNKILNFTIDGSSTSCLCNDNEIDLDKLAVKIDEILNLKTIIDQQGHTIDELKKTNCKEMSECCTQTEEFYTDIKKRDEQIRQYKEIIKVLKKKLDDLVQLDRERQNDYHKLQDEHNKLSVDYFKRGDAIEELQNEVKNLEAIIEELKLEQNKTDQHLNEKFQTELHTIIQKYEQLKKSFTDVSQNFLLIDKENMALKATLHQNNDQIVFLQNRIEMYEENSATFQDLLQSLKIRLKEAEERLKDTSKFEEENVLLKEKLREVKCNYALARKELETMCKDLELANEKEQLIDKVNELTRQEQELETKINKKMEELYRICQKIHRAQNECSITLRNTGNDNVSACLNRISDLETEIKQLYNERNYLKQTIVELREKDQEHVHEIEKLKCHLKQAEEEAKQMEIKTNDLLRRINNQNNISQQLKHLEDVVTERLKQRTLTHQDAHIQVSTNYDEKLLAIENAYKFEIQSLQNSFKEIMCRELEALHADYGAKITKLETEKKYLEQCIQSMDVCANETIKDINSEKQVIKEMLSKVSNQLSTFDRREANWKQKEETLEKEKQILQRGVDKFARTMLEFYVKYQKMRANIKRIKDEKFTYYEYARTLKKKMLQQSPPRPRRSLSESSIASSEEMQVFRVPEIETKTNSVVKRRPEPSQKKKLIKPTNTVAKGKPTTRDCIKSSDLNKQKHLRQSKLVTRNK